MYGKNWFSDQASLITIADPDIGDKTSLHTVFVKHLDHILINFEQNRMVRTMKIFDLFDYFLQSTDTILDNVFVTK